MKTSIKKTRPLAALIAAGGLLASGAALAVPMGLSFGVGPETDVENCIFVGPGNMCTLFAGSGSAPDDTPTGNSPGSDTYEDASHTYTVGQLITALGGDNSFNITIDSNYAATQNPTDFLNLFQVFFNDTAMTGDAAWEFSGMEAMNSGPNGTGKANFLLTGPVDLSGLMETDTVDFYLKMSGLTDGAEQFGLLAAGFIDPCINNPNLPGCDGGGDNGGGDNGGGDNGGGDNGGGDNGGGDNGGTPIPEPGSLLLFGIGLLALGRSRRIRKLVSE